MVTTMNELTITNDNPAREWHAFDDPEGPIGRGKTREEALIDLYEQTAEECSRHLREREEWRAAAQGWEIGGERITKAENVLVKLLSETQRENRTLRACLQDAHDRADLAQSNYLHHAKLLSEEQSFRREALRLIRVLSFPPRPSASQLEQAQAFLTANEND